jgi:MoxR-like ATPase
MSKISDDVQGLKDLSQSIQLIKKEIGKVIVGQNNIIEQLLISIFAKGHVLLIGVPGLAKTLLIRTLAQVLDLKFSRIQFTPDLMPGDITGTEVIEENISTKEKIFKFIKGPVFANIILADEINRTPPKTQSSLLQAMEEKEVTAAGSTYKLEPPFFVLSTQNPIEQEGTYPLPEAQLDRFMFNIWLDYPSLNEEIDIVRSTTTEFVPAVNKILTAEQILEFQNLVRRIPVAENVIKYAVELVRASRPETTKFPFIKEFISYGAGPRASQYLILGAKSRAALLGKYSPEIEDIKAVALPVMRHRIVTNFNAEAENMPANKIIEKLVQEIKV